MNTAIKWVLFIILGIVVTQLIINILGNDNIKQIRNDLKQAKLSADSALAELEKSKIVIDSMREDVALFRSYVTNIKKTVELKDLEKELKDAKDAARILELKEEIKKLRGEMDLDNWPDIEVVYTKKSK